MLSIPSVNSVSSENETTLLANDFSKIIKAGDKIILNGELGSGKTFFVKKCLINFKINNVNSPTFAIVNEYNGKLDFFHFDFYRLNNYQELLDIGWLDYMNNDEAVTFIEWGNLIPEALPKSRIEIIINFTGETSREFRFSRYE